MTDKQIKCFQVLAEQLNYTKAAQILGISQSTLSVHIAALEKGFGFPLFARSNRSVELSPEGEIFIEALDQISHIWKQAQKDAAGLRTGEKRVLKLGIFEGQNTTGFYQKVWKQFQDKYPKIQLEIRSFGNAELIEKLDDGEVDAIFGYQDLLSLRKDLDGVTVYKSPLYLVFLNNGEPEEETWDAAEDLKEKCFILQSKGAAPLLNQYFEKFCRKQNISPQKIIRVSNTASVMMNIELGLGIGLADDLSIIFQKPQFRFLKTEDIYVEYSLIYKQNHKNKELRLFLDELTV